ncbi:MAG: hypothetical protein AAGA42_10255 [Actinomycetota bacterium]
MPTSPAASLDSGSHDGHLVHPLIASACDYDDELRGAGHSERILAAVHARNEMISAIREVTARTPKTSPPDIAPF